MNALNSKRLEEGLSQKKTVKEVINLALEAVNIDAGASETQIVEITAELDNEKSMTGDGARAIELSYRKIEETRIALVSSRDKVSLIKEKGNGAYRGRETVRVECISLQAEIASMKTEIDALRLVRDISVV